MDITIAEAIADIARNLATPLGWVGSLTVIGLVVVFISLQVKQVCLLEEQLKHQRELERMYPRQQKKPKKVTQ